MERKKFYRSVWFWVVIVVLLALALSSLFGRSGDEYEEVPTSVALEQLRDGNVEGVTINDREQTVDLDLDEAVDGSRQITASYPIGAEDDIFDLAATAG